MSSIDLWYTARATGLTLLVLLTATTCLGILTAGRAASTLPAFARAEIHKWIASLTVAFLAVHVFASVIDSYVHISWLAIVVPFTSSYHTLWLAFGTVATDALLTVAVSSALRHRIEARTWRLFHWIAYVSWPTAVIHGLAMGTDMRLRWVLAVVAACVASVVGLTAWRIADWKRTRAKLPTTVTSPRGSLRERRSSGAQRHGVVT
jgi:sulfoxide reductase heme-binding subunit YedZ